MKLCIYCQTNEADTDDHVPPKGMFTGSRKNLITVPACRACNNGFAAEDEYFLNIVLDWRASESKAGEAAAWKRVRAMNRNGGRNHLRSIRESFRPVDVYSRAGLYLARSAQFSLSNERLTRTVERIVRGLYFHVRGVPLPTGSSCVAARADIFRRAIGDDAELSAYVTRLSRSPRLARGDGVFECGYEVDEEDPNSSMWYVVFYGCVGFVGATGCDRGRDTGPTSEHAVELIKDIPEGRRLRSWLPAAGSGGLTC